MSSALDQALRLAQLAHESVREQQRDQRVLHALTIRGVRMLLDTRASDPPPAAEHLLAAARADIEESRS